jgi:hypothetical protein
MRLCDIRNLAAFAQQYRNSKVEYFAEWVVIIVAKPLAQLKYVRTD